MYGLIRVAAASPELRVADCKYNTEKILDLINLAYKDSVEIMVFPELSVTGYSCGDLFFQTTLLSSCEKSIEHILENTKDTKMLIAIGAPVQYKNQLLNCALLIEEGKILGIVPKTFLPNYSEFYEKRWFSSLADIETGEIFFANQKTVIGNILFTCENNPHLSIGMEICEDLWAPIPPSSLLALNGASIILNLSASNELATKHEYRKSLVAHQSAKNICGYIYSSAGIYESTQDTVFSGHCMICENGSLLTESTRFAKDSQITITDIDLELFSQDRSKNTSFKNSISKKVTPEITKIKFTLENNNKTNIKRTIDPMPFVPKNNELLEERCSDIFNIQLTGLAKRFSHANANVLVIGISGGLDSTLALLVATKTCDFLEIPRKSIIGITMPGFGTTDRTYNNAISLMETLGITLKEISIKDACIQHFKAIGHDINIQNTTYENTQARERTQILMDIANMENGLVVGTGDLSELALGWATYNGDHMSMYGINSGVPKTLVRVLVEHIANSKHLDNNAKNILRDILATPVSPELLPPSENGDINQKTEDIVGPYELHDFFLYYIVRFGFSPKKILFLAEEAFKEKYPRKILIKWLKNFYSRFFSQQFKRSCLPDGPKVGTISLSPRGDWRMPSDAVNDAWIKEINDILD